MATIYNETDYTFTPSAQQAINNAAANMGVDEVNTQLSKPDNQFDLFDNDENYLFSIDTSTDLIYDNRA